MNESKTHRYVTDNRDYPEERQYEIQVTHGANGDFYLAMVQKGKRSVHGVRFCTSGGAARANPAALKAVSDLFIALGGWDKPGIFDTDEE